MSDGYGSFDSLAGVESYETPSETQSGVAEEARGPRLCDPALTGCAWAWGSFTARQPRLPRPSLLYTDWKEAFA